MPYPKPDHPHYCPGSETTPSGYDPELVWQRCDQCGRPIAAKANGLLFAHLDHPTRRKDAVQEGLIAHGLNRREALGRITYAEDEPDGESDGLEEELED